LVGVAGPGHFVAYYKRFSRLWEQYNNLNTKVKSCSQNETINPVAAVYIIHKDKYGMYIQVICQI